MSIFDLSQFQNPRLRISKEFMDQSGIVAQCGFHVLRGTISQLQPEYFWRKSVKKCEIVEVGIFGDDVESIGLGIGPND
jgi:hypothetical protein